MESDPGGLAGSPTEVQLQLVRYDGLPGVTLQLQGIEHVLERHDGFVGAYARSRSAPRRFDRAPRRPFNDAAAYTDVALAGAADAPFNTHAEVDWPKVDWAKAGAANTVADATAAISVFMVSLHRTHLR